MKRKDIKFGILTSLVILGFLLTISPPDAQSEKGWTNYTTGNSELSHNHIRSIAEDKNGVIWAGTDKGAHSFREGRWSESYEKTKSSSVFSIAAENSDTVWFGMRGKLLRKRNGEWGAYNGEKNNISERSRIRSIAVSTTSKKWLGTSMDGVIGFEKKNEEEIWEPRISTTPPNVIDSNNIRSIAVVESCNTKWFGTDKGAYSYDGQQIIKLNLKNFLETDNVYSIYVDRDENVWFGTIGGLARKDALSGDIKTFTREDGIPENQVNAISQDPLGNIWVGTPVGAAKYDGEEWFKYNIHNSGLVGNNIQDIAIESDLDRTIWFATTDGLSRLKIKEVTALEGTVALQGGYEGYINPSVGDVAKIIFTAASPGEIEVHIYNSLGRLVKKLSESADGHKDEYIIWDCRNESGSVVSSGVYTAYIEGPGIESVKHIPVVR